ARDPQELLAAAEERIFAIGDERSTDSVESVDAMLSDVFLMLEKRQGMETTGVSTGYRDLDKMCGGFHGSELLILAARPGVGKTALALNIADHVAVQDEKAVLFVSLEMAGSELVTRLLCARGEVNGISLRNGLISGEDHGKLQNAANVFYGAEFYIDDTPARTITEIAAVARRLARRSKRELGLIVIDYLQLIEPDNSRDPRQEQVSKISRQLKQLSRKLQVPVLCLAQLNRQVESGSRDQRPKLSHLRESGAIEQDADMVMFIHREDYGLSSEDIRKKDVEGRAELIVAKQRNGPTGEIRLLWRKEFGRFYPAASANTEEAFSDYGGF
ncbi:MAG: replicative DNA helicase, partial [Planctomycetia bacterium]|nr:replicative DNA helicase [Planctomycetia bacterium]